LGQPRPFRDFLERKQTSLSTLSSTISDSMIFFTSDTHFGDSRVLRIDRRPFPDMATHDVALIRNWNLIVGIDDEVWHLGDFMSSRAGDCDTLLDRLHGRKHLIVGNNDLEATTDASGWSSVQHYKELTLDGYHLVLCHYAFRTWNKIGKGSVNLHGHSHGRLKPVPRQFDVGVDARELQPVRLDVLLASTRLKADARRAK
jgi:calcineurin-like phosphoesterase family protein